MRDSYNILIVEDDWDINGLLKEVLSKEGYNVTSAYSGTEGRMCLERNDYDLVMLDLMLPGVSGEYLIEETRKEKAMPIIVISAKTNIQDRISVLKGGADDFICKPFDINEVLARVEAQIRRYTSFSKVVRDSTRIVHKDLSLDSESRKVLVKEKEVNLTAREFDILEILLKYPTKVFTRQNLFESVWKDEFVEDYNTINVHVSNIRTKISKIDSETEYIQTVWGIGFKLKE